MRFDDDDSVDLERAGFLRKDLAAFEKHVACEAFSQYVSDVEAMINDGKEATVYLCRTQAWVEVPYLAAKMYRARKFRAFANEQEYVNAERIVDRRMRKAIRHRTAKGKRLSHFMWISQEWKAMQILHEAGASVPVPYAHADDGILMEFIGDENGTAPMLVHVDLSAGEAQPAFESLMRDVELMLANDIVHGDLSAYNVLYHDARARLIDLPQAVDAMQDANAMELLRRDVENLCKYFAKRGLDVDATAITVDLWSRYF
jgi:RIO kinase 1